jgi:hypothetical protein
VSICTRNQFLPPMVHDIRLKKVIIPPQIALNHTQEAINEFEGLNFLNRVYSTFVCFFSIKCTKTQNKVISVVQNISARN